MRNFVTREKALRRKDQVSSLVTRHLQNDERETELEDDLNRYQVAEDVVISLFRRREETSDEKDGCEPSKPGPTARQDRKGNGPVNSQFVAEQVSQPNGSAREP